MEKLITRVSHSEFVKSNEKLPAKASDHVSLSLYLIITPHLLALANG